MHLVTLEMIEIYTDKLHLHFENDDRIFTLKNTFGCDDKNNMIVYDGESSSPLKVGKQFQIIDWHENFEWTCKIILQL